MAAPATSVLDRWMTTLIGKRPKIFCHGWGDADVIRALRWISAGEQAHHQKRSSVEPKDVIREVYADDEVTRSSPRKFVAKGIEGDAAYREHLFRAPIVVTYTKEESPARAILPMNARMARFELVLPRFLLSHFNVEGADTKETVKQGGPGSSRFWQLAEENGVAPSIPLCFQYSATGDHGYFKRRTWIARPLAGEGVASLIMESPFYGSRCPADQIDSSLCNVSDLMAMGAGLVSETMCLIHHFEKQQSVERDDSVGNQAGAHGLQEQQELQEEQQIRRARDELGSSPLSLQIDAEAPDAFDPLPEKSAVSRAWDRTAAAVSGAFQSQITRLQEARERARLAGRGSVLMEDVQTLKVPLGPFCLTGLSMGGHIAALAAAISRLEVGVVPCISPYSAGPVFLNGCLRDWCDWETLKRHFGQCEEDELSERFLRFLTPTDVTRYAPPVLPHCAIQVAAKSDAYIPGTGVHIHEHWKGSELRWVPGGHVLSFIAPGSLRAFRSAILDSLWRVHLHKYCGHDGDTFGAMYPGRIPPADAATTSS